MSTTPILSNSMGLDSLCRVRAVFGYCRRSESLEAGDGSRKGVLRLSVRRSRCRSNAIEVHYVFNMALLVNSDHIVGVNDMIRPDYAQPPSGRPSSISPCGPPLYLDGCTRIVYDCSTQLAMRTVPLLGRSHMAKVQWTSSILNTISWPR